MLGDTMEINKVEGQDKGKIVLYALSTCVWCKKTKTLLNSLGVAYSFIDVDMLPKVDKDKVVEEVKKFNPVCTFPTIVIDDEKCIRGYKEDEIRQALAP
jgi:glutaredoxin